MLCIFHHSSEKRRKKRKLGLQMPLPGRAAVLCRCGPTLTRELGREAERCVLIRSGSDGPSSKSAQIFAIFCSPVSLSSPHGGTWVFSAFPNSDHTHARLSTALG